MLSAAIHHLLGDLVDMLSVHAPLSRTLPVALSGTLSPIYTLESRGLDRGVGGLDDVRMPLSCRPGDLPRS